MYKPVDDRNILKDVNARKEFVMYTAVDSAPKRVPFIDLSKIRMSGPKFLQLQSYQSLVGRLINPESKFTRLLLKWETGMGKTLGAIAAALEFTPYFVRDEKAGIPNIGSVFVIGFSGDEIKQQLLSFPELGFITEEELKQVNKLRDLNSRGLLQNTDLLRDIISRAKRRFNNRQHNGFLKFMGYKEATNRLFKVKKGNINTLTNDELNELIRTGEVIIDQMILRGFDNSVLLCDEIPNTYNTEKKNNWGAMVKYVLDNAVNVRAVFMSATPFNNSPTEVVDLINYLVPGSNLKKTDLFVMKASAFSRNGAKLKPTALAKIRDLCRGRISFLRDTTPSFFPQRVLSGNPIKGIDYLKFIRCPMSATHFNLYNANYDGVLAHDSTYIVDMVLPSPDGWIYKTDDIRAIQQAPSQWKQKNQIDFSNEKLTGGIFGRNAMLSTISMKYYKMITDIISYIKGKAGAGKYPGKIMLFHPIVHMSGVLLISEILKQNQFLGEFEAPRQNTFCLCGREMREHEMKATGGAVIHRGPYNINTKTGYVTKTKTGERLFKVVIRDKIIYTQDVSFNPHKMSQFRQAFTAIKRNSPIVVETLLTSIDVHKLLADLGFTVWKTTTRKPRIYFVDDRKTLNKLIKIRRAKRTPKKRPKKGGASICDEFRPIRFILMHSGIDHATRQRSKEKFNDVSNVNGERITILVGSKLIREAYNFTALRQLWILRRPVNISTLKQVFGRGHRKNSHIDLPVEDRNIEYRIYTTCLPTKVKGDYQRSYEEEKYAQKMQDYKIIQQIEQVLHEVAVDSAINYKIIHKPSTDPLHKFDMLPFKPEETKVSKKLKTSTFLAYHSDEEINLLKYTIKRLFVEISPIWKYDDLWKSVRNPPFSIEANPIFSQHAFNVALFSLMWTNNNIISPHEQSTIRSLLDNKAQVIFIDGEPRVIAHIGKEFYALLPFKNNAPVFEIEAYSSFTAAAPVAINIQHFLRSNQMISFDERFKRFYNKWHMVHIDKLESSICDFGGEFQTELIEKCIKYIFDYLTSKTRRKSQHHNFMFKMLYYYDLRNIIVWVSTAKSYIAKRYEKYSRPVVAIVPIKKRADGELSVINMLKSTLDKSVVNWAPGQARSYYRDNLAAVMAIKPGKIPANMLPVGQLLSKIPRFYMPENKIEQWVSEPRYIKKIVYKENNIVIGYDEKTDTRIHSRFKIRNPKTIKHSDSRKIEKGSVCAASKGKDHIISLLRKLNVKIPEKINVNGLCTILRTALIRNELLERLNGTDIKWFYFSYEV